jgi:predicted transcriptional regulator
METKITIGEQIKKVVDEKGISVAWLAKKMPCSASNIYKIYKKNLIDCRTLCRISMLLDYDFCSYMKSIIMESLRK